MTLKICTESIDSFHKHNGLMSSLSLSFANRKFSSSLSPLGHSKAVRDICFNNSGTQFLSAAYDRYLKLWDTETGEFKNK